jgi:mannosyltransferase OCH1-like enzyme
MHPGWEFMTHRHYPVDRGRLRAEYEASITGAGKADILRMEVLYRFGGIYVDVDVEPLHSFDDLLAYDCFFGDMPNEEGGSILATGVIGSVPWHPAIGAYIEGLPARFKLSPEGETDPWVIQNWRTGPPAATALIRGRSDITLLPEATFYPVHWTKKAEPPYPPESYAVYHATQDWSLE